MTNPDNWNEAYKRAKQLWGSEPDHVLTEYANLVPSGHILDLGIGEGRNSLFWAELGYSVEGIDISEVAVGRCMDRAREARLDVHAEVGQLKDYQITQGKYSLIIAAWVLNFFSKDDAYEILQRIKDGLQKDGVVYISVFSPDDPGYARRFDPSTRYYFTSDKIAAVFDDFELFHLSKATVWDRGHGAPHYHGVVIYMGRKRH
jgi:cyclopropane fatty-acyl-phospholipid synthase-like methyltransferase